MDSIPGGLARIDYLADHPDLAPTLAAWHQAQWSYLSPATTVEQRLARLHKHLAKRQVPTTFVALDGDQPVGCASLVHADMSIRPQLAPWLASVYVLPSHRRQGIGSALVRRVCHEAAGLQVATLYLYTPDKEHFYAALGWSLLEHIEYRGYEMAVMQISPSSSFP